MENKTQKVLEHLLNNETITSWEAIQKFRATRLSAIIFNLRERGYLINTEMVRDGECPYAIYRLVGTPDER